MRYDLYEKGENGLPALRDSNTGFAVKVGYEWASHIQINLTYKASVTNLLDANRNEAKMYPHALYVGIGYCFGNGLK